MNRESNNQMLMVKRGNTKPRNNEIGFRLFSCFLILGATGLTMAQDRRDATPAPPSEAKESKPKGDNARILTGQVVDPDDKPVAHCHVAMVVVEDSWDEKPKGNSWAAVRDSKVWGPGETGPDGRFRLTGPPGSSPSPANVSASLVAAAPGYSLAIHSLTISPADQAKRHQDVTIKLEPERVIRGRLIDVQGQPAAGVKLHLVRPGPKFAPHAVYEPFEGLLAFWPKPVTSDDKGRFVLHGIGQGQTATLEVLDDDDRFAPQLLKVQEETPDDSSVVTVPLAPAQIIEGRVIYADTGKPVPKARIGYTGLWRGGAESNWMSGQADPQGFFHQSLPVANQFILRGHAGKGESYLPVEKRVEWPKGTVKHRLDIALERGVLVRGKVTEAPSGKPVRWAHVKFIPRDDNPHYKTGIVTDIHRELLTRSDGRFELVVLPGPGYLLVEGDMPDYIHLEIGAGQLQTGQPSGKRLYPDGLVKMDYPPGTQPQDVEISLRRGVTLQGRLLGPDDRPVAQAQMFCRFTLGDPRAGSHYDYFLMILRGRPVWRAPAEVRDGRFEIHGCDPEKTFSVQFLDSANHLGATVELAGKQPGIKPVTVKLRPCGSATAQFCDPDGKPVSGSLIQSEFPFEALLTMVVTPGGSPFDPKAVKEQSLLADLFLVEHLRANQEGRVTIQGLIPDATYRLVWFEPDGPRQKEFKAESGKTVELPKITVSKPK